MMNGSSRRPIEIAVIRTFALQPFGHPTPRRSVKGSQTRAG
ncbi:MAG: hypothetical protein ACHBN1_34250 [Heteroscytonema crispum UTEX LB 1556]